MMNLRPKECAQFLLEFSGVVYHSVEQHPMAVAFGWYVVYSWHGSPRMCRYPKVTPRRVIVHRLCCQLCQIPVHLLADSRPVPVRVFRPVEVLSHPFHTDQILTVCNVEAVAFPAAGLTLIPNLLSSQCFFRFFHRNLHYSSNLVWSTLCSNPEILRTASSYFSRCRRPFATW